MPRIIGFLGRRRRGKTTAAIYTQELLSNKTSIKISFADKIRDDVLLLYPFLTLDDLTVNKEVPFTLNKTSLLDNSGIPYAYCGRDFLIKYGEHVRYNHDAIYWVTALKKKISTLTEDLIVIDDMRRINECFSLKENNQEMLIIKLERDDLEKNNYDDSEVEEEVDRVPSYLIDHTIKSHYTDDAQDLKDQLKSYYQSIGLI